MYFQARLEGSVWLGIASEEEFVPLIWAPTRIIKFANCKENQPDNQGGNEVSYRKLNLNLPLKDKPVCLVYTSVLNKTHLVYTFGHHW